MKALKKVLISVCSALVLGCLAIGGLSLKTNVAKAGSSGENYFFGGASVRLVDDKHGPGVKFHIWMTLDEFDCYGSINGDTLTLDSGYTTGTIILPHYLLKGDELTYGYVASNGAKAHCEYTNNLWHKVKINHLWYAESVVYLYNIPENQYGTEMAVRGVVFKDGEPIRYTKQESGISMSYVANEEYKDVNTKLNSEELESLYNTYIKKNVNVVVNGVSHALNVDYLDGISEIVPAKQDDGDKFAYFSSATGKQVSLEEITKNHQPLLYALYRESIVLNAATPSYNLSAYKRNATDTVKSMTFTAADGTTYDLGSNPDNVTAGAGYATLKTELQDHGEGTVTAVLNDGNADYTLSLPALVVTADIADVDTFTSIINYTDSVYYNASSRSLFGYFRLKGNIALQQTTVAGYDNVSSMGPYGFRGTLDGMGYTISGGWTGGGGVFGTIGEGALIKNVNFSTPYLHNGSCAVWAMYIYNATLENITVTSTSVSNYNADAAPGDWMGYLVVQGIQGSTFRNITVNASGSIKTLFGGMATQNYQPNNTFDGFYINATHVDYIGTGLKNGAKYHYTIADEIAAGQDIIFNGVGGAGNRVTLDEQAFVFNGTTASRKFALNLGAHDDGFTVESIKFGSFDLGTNPNALDVSALREDLSAHGEGNIVVTLTNDTSVKTVTVPTLFVTHEITSAQEFDVVFACDQSISPYYNDNKAFLGYYRLANDIGYIGTSMSDSWAFNGLNRSGTSVWINSTTHGLRGTFDGNGYTITGVSGNGGLFNCIGADAVIKDVNIITHGHAGQSHVAVLAKTICGTKTNNVLLENVTITFKPTLQSPWGNSPSTQQHMGFLTSTGTSGATFRNVTVDASSIKDRTDFNSFIFVFGNGNDAYYESHFHDRTQATPNTYESFMLYGRFQPNDTTSIDCLGVYYDFATKTSKVVTVADEIASGANIMYNGTNWTEKTVTLDERQEFMMLHTSFWLDLGEYANQKIESIKLGDTDLGTDLDDLDLSAFITDYANHGEQTISVICVSGSTRTTVNVPVLLISKDIWTESDLKEALWFKTSNRFYDATAKAIFGYFRLKNDIAVSLNGWSNHSRNDSFTHANQQQGFRGTFDGASHTLSTNNPGSFGLFTSIGEGAVIKDVNISMNAYYNSGYTAVLANYIQGATLENMIITTKQSVQYNASLPTETIKEKDENGKDVVLQSSRYEQMGYLAINGASDTTFRNVTVNPGGQIYTLFGGYTWQEYEKANIGPNVYENFVVDATTIDYIGFKNVNQVSTGISMEEEIFSGSGIRYNGNTVEDLAADLTLEHHDIVLAGVNAENGSKQKIDFGMYLVYGQSVKAVSITMPSGDTQNFTFDEGLDLLNDKITDIIPATILNDVTLHGEGYKVVVTTQYNTKVTIPVSIVTYEITQGAELDNSEGGLLMFNESNPYFNATTNTIDGYFTLGKDISFWSTPNNTTGNNTGFSFDDANHGFIGTFDGRNFIVTSTARDHINSSDQEVKGGASTYGLFGQLGTGALVKNVHIVVNTYAHGQHTSALAETAYNATIENVTISVTTINGDAYGYNGDETLVEDIKGLITARGIGGCTFTDVTVNLNGGRITSLFGGRQYNGYEYAEKAGQNTYNGLTINGTVDYIGTGMDANEDRHSFTIQEEIDSGANITYNP